MGKIDTDAYYGLIPEEYKSDSVKAPERVTTLAASLLEKMEKQGYSIFEIKMLGDILVKEAVASLGPAYFIDYKRRL